MGDKTKGLIDKFIVKRRDGRDAPGEKHDGCEYFVLDLTHDIFAIPAIEAYIISCKEEYPFLAGDLLAKIGEASKRLGEIPACNCIERTNEILRKNNTNTILEVPVTINMQTGQVLPPRLVIATTKDDTTKKRGKPITVFVTYCPFCGRKYHE
jgi:hypothetical protein